MSFGEVLKEQRKIADLTQKKLATESGVSRTYLSDVENDRYNPSVKFIEKVTNGLAQKRELSNEEKNHLYNLLMEEAGYGYKPVENTSLIGALMDSAHKRHELFREYAINQKIDIDSDSGFLDLYYQSKNYYDNYIDFKEGHFVRDISEILHYLNNIALLYQDEEMSKEDKIHYMNLYFKILNDTYKPLFNDIQEYLFTNLDND